MASEFDWTLGDNDAEVYALSYIDSDGAEQIENLTGKTVTLELYPTGSTTAVVVSAWTIAVLSAAAGTVSVTRPATGHNLSADPGTYLGRFKVTGAGVTRSFPKGQPARWRVRT
jgi:hypothetical protein